MSASDPIPTPPYCKPLQIGLERGWLTLIHETESRFTPKAGRRRRALMECRCGNRVVVAVTNWKSGNTSSCGCRFRSGNDRFRGRPGFASWHSIIQRTTLGSGTQKRRPNYVGVERDPRWDDYEAFWADVGDSWFEGAELSRIGDVGGYTKDNVRWLTKSENSREARERVMPRMSDGRFASDVAHENGISRSTFWARLNAYGWSVDDAATIPKYGRYGGADRSLQG